MPNPIKEGMIRQSTDNPLWYDLRMLGTGDKIIGRSVIRRDGMVFVKTNFDEIPIYKIKMDGNLMKLLKEYVGEWDQG